MSSAPVEALLPFAAAQRRLASSVSASCDLGEMAARVGPAYWQAAMEEIFSSAVPQKEQAPDFAIEEKYRDGFEDVSPFCRVWRFNGAGNRDGRPFVIAAPNSGTAVQQMRAAVAAFLPHGNVRLVEQRDPHYVNGEHKNGLDDSTAALVEVARRNPNCHLISFSQSGVPASVATAWMFQNPALYRGLEPASLTVIGSPINAELTSDYSINWMNWIAKNTCADPVFIPVGFGYEGAGRMILPGAVPKLYFDKAPGDSRAGMVAQALPAEHIRDTLERVFRQYRLPHGKYDFNGQRIDTQAIGCDVLTFAGEEDRICPPAQTHDLHRLTSRAASHLETTLEDVGHYGLVGAEVLGRIVAPAVTALAARHAPAKHLRYAR